jgi:hypothetical protein
MESKILLGSFLCIIIARISIGATLSATGQTDTSKASEAQLIAVLNPAISNKIVERVLRIGVFS